MGGDNNRSRRVGELIQRELATLLTREVKDPRLSLVSITAVDVTRDMSIARIFYTVIDSHVDNVDAEENKTRVQQGLQKAAGFLRYELGQRIELRNVPRLDFRYDDSIIHGARLTRLIDDAIENDQKRRDNDSSD